ncbi:MAG: class I SAM-dependent methyltransferase [Gammaproteobacteria bacterium]|nr:class I SAM-dependent methyltransferase [Gammaproteobacteria bacterium]
MSTSTKFTDSVANYLRSSAKESASLKALRRETEASFKSARMMSSPEQVEFLQWLMHLMQVTRVIEVGVFTGYGTLAMAEALPNAGYLLACERSDKYAAINHEFWQHAKVDNKIDLKIAPALETLQQQIDANESLFDFAYIDADKDNYPNYYQLLLKLIRPGGVMIFDNIIWVADQIVPEAKVKFTEQLHQFAEALIKNPELQTTLVPLGGGMLMVRV